jgi:multiple sugar transport system permease protein
MTNKNNTLGGFWERNRKSGGYLLRHRVGGFLFRVCRALFLFGLCFLILQPLINKLSLSFMEQQDLYDPTVIAIPRHFTSDNYNMVNKLLDLWPSLFRTILIAGMVAILQVMSCTLAGYGFARFNFPLKKLLFICVMLVIVVPPQTILAPLYLNFRFFDIFGLIKLINGDSVNLLNGVGGMVLLAVTGMGLKSGLYIFMMRQYFRGVPRELDEAAQVDGCGKLRTFISIMLPDAMPMITSCFLFAFVWQWTDSLYTSFFLTKYKVLSTQLVGLADRMREYYFKLYETGIGVGYLQTIIATGMLVCLVPLILLYLFAQKAFVESLSQTGIKM